MSIAENRNQKIYLTNPVWGLVLGPCGSVTWSISLTGRDLWKLTVIRVTREKCLSVENSCGYKARTGGRDLQLFAFSCAELICCTFYSAMGIFIYYAGLGRG